MKLLINKQNTTSSADLWMYSDLLWFN